MQDLDYDEIEGMRQECESKDTAYCFRYAGGTTRYYHSRELIEGCQTAANWFTKYLDDNTNKWHAIPQGFLAPHFPEYYVDAINILREEDDLHVNSYLIEAAKALDKTHNSGEDHFKILSLDDDLSWDDKNRMRALLCSEVVTYRYMQPWNGQHHHYQGPLPQRGEQDAADRLIELLSSLHSPTYSYRTPTGLPDSYWILLGLQQISYWLITIQIWYPRPTGVLVNSYWNH